MLELLGGLIWGMVTSKLADSALSGIVGNRVDAGACRLFTGIRERVLKPTPENHDLQRAMLEALRDGVETVSRKALKPLSGNDKRQVEDWLKQQIKRINQEIQAVQRGEGVTGTTENWSILLRATSAEMEGLGLRQVNAQLRQVKAQLEQQLQVETLPTVFREEFEAEWLAWVNLYLAEAVKTNPRVAEILQVELLLDVQTGIEHLTELLDNPQRFLGAVQLIDFDAEALRADLDGWRQSLTGHLEALKQQMGEGFLETQRRVDLRIDEVVEVVLRMQEAPPQMVSTNVITVPPNLEHWLGRDTEIAQLKLWIADPVVDTIGLQGLGGIGKSALASRLYELADGFEAKFWADVSQHPDFTAFAEQALSALGHYSRAQIAKLDPTQFINLLLNCLNQRRCLLVLDNLETLLDGARGWVEPSYEQFFARWVAQGKTSVLLVTTQEKPTLFQPELNWLVVQGMTAENGGLLLQDLGIQGSLPDLQQFAVAVDGHPLTLYLVAGYLREYCNAQLSRSEEFGLSNVNQLMREAKGLHRSQSNVSAALILQRHLDRLTPELRGLLLRLSVYRQPFDRNAAAFMVGLGAEPANALATQQALQELLNRSLLVKVKDGRYQFLSFVAAYLNQQAPEQPEAHEQAIHYYRSIAKAHDSWKSIDDISPNLEAFYHRCEQRQYGLAYETLASCYQFLSFRGYNALLIEVYTQLIKRLENIPTLSTQEQEQFGWALSIVADALGHTGKLQQAIQYCDRQRTWSQTIAHRRLEADALRGLGNQYLGLGQLHKAIEYYEQCLEIAREVGDHSHEGRALGSLGAAYFSLSQFEKAIEYSKQQLAIAREVGDHIGEGCALGGLGNAYSSLSQFHKAIEYYEQRLAIVREVSYRSDEGRALGGLGNAYNSLSQFHKAIQYHEQWLAIAREVGDPSDEGRALGGLGNDYYSLSQFHKAIEYYKQYLEIAREVGDPSDEGCALGNLGSAYHSLSQFHKAIKYHEQQLAIAREIGNRDGEGSALGGLGSAYHSLSQFEKAIEYSKQQLAIAREVGNRRGEGSALGNLGNAYSSLSQFHKATEYYEQGLAIAREVGDRQGEGSALCGLGDAYYRLSQFEKTIEYDEQYLSIMQEVGNRRGEGSALCGLGNAYNGLSQFEKAIEYYEQYLSIAREVGDRQGEGMALGNLGNAYNSLSQSNRAIEYHQQQLEITRSIGDRNQEGECLGRLGIAQYGLQQYQEAYEYSQSSLTILKAIGNPFSSAYFGHYCGGRALAKLRKRKEAKVLLYKAYQAFRELGTTQYASCAWQELSQLGESYAKDQDFPGAIELYQSQLQALEEMDDQANQGWVFQAMGKLYYEKLD